MSYEPPPYEAMLFLLDKLFVRHYESLVKELKLNEEQARYLGHTLDLEIDELDSNQKRQIENSLHPLFLSDIKDQHITLEGFRLIQRAVEELERKRGFGSDSGTAIAASAQLNLENYFCFVYLKETLLTSLKDNLKTVNNSFALFRISQFLLNDEVRRFRNAFAHAAWKVNKSSPSSFLKYWDGGREYNLSEERWLLMRNLSYAISYVIVGKL